jgi:ABC-2 type transport system permease protein
VEGETGSRTLAVAVRGSFESFFKGKASPFEEAGATAAESGAPDPVEQPLGTIESSPESARLVVIGSSEFVDDVVLDISARLSADRYLNSLQLIQNAVDWAVEDEDLLSIRSRGTFARLLKPLDTDEQSLWEGLNYGLALAALLAIGAIWYLSRRNEQPMALVEVHEGEGDGGQAPAQAPEPPLEKEVSSDTESTGRRA